MKHAYMFWYKSTETAPTEYIYIVAITEKQAIYFFKFRGYMRFSDYSLRPIDVINETDFIKPHEVGDILGQYAII